MRINSSLSERLYIIINTAMVLVYAGCGIFLLLNHKIAIPTLSKKVFGCSLILYSAYRGFLLIRKIKKSSDEN
jgi:hypothetical protein